MPLRTLSFGVRIVFENPRFITCYVMFEKLLSFSMRSRKSRHTFLRFSFCSLVGIFRTSLAQIFVDGLAIQIQHTTDHSDCQTSIRPHEIPHFGHIFVHFDVKSLPERGSFSTPSWSSKNALCHLKTVSLIQHALHKPFSIFRKFMLRFH